EILSLLDKTREDDLVLCLLSGGGSALLTAPAKGITLKDIQILTDLLLRSGAAINEINSLRKHISLIKGGRIAGNAYPSTLVSLILSDVIGDDLSTIASGPTHPDSTTFADCIDILEHYRLKDKIPQNILNHLVKGVEGKEKESLKEGDIAFEKTQNSIVANNIQALLTAKDMAEDMGYRTMVISSSIGGETREVAKVHTAAIKEVISSGNPIKRPACIISGGETTVTVKGEGKGGRSQEFALASAIEIEGIENVVILSAGTDGIDGPTDAAGALVDGNTVKEAKAKGLNPQAYLDNNDSYNFFKPLNLLLVTGPTGTNVMDMRVMLVD
ncbi:MAG: glycerate kinase, partial [Thermodesulfobacteriota bacterium]